MDEFDAALASVRAQRIDALIVWNTPLFLTNAKHLAELAIKHRVPLVGNQEFAESGALLGYGANILDNYRRVGYFVDRISKGANPATMPIEQPTTFELVANLKTAKALGITLPPSVMVRAERVIQ
jgi:putative ABC transport system substrate-binding protein